ncbi:MAG: hypothetical protein NTV04_18905, partial [Deltaproteobacteria bacterium]|nr:hypothetical protein [Deltaproteobacteria bacterium]
LEYGTAEPRTCREDPQDVVALPATLSLILDPKNKQKSCLTNFSTLLKFSQFSLPKNKTRKIYPSGGFYEKGSPEVANSKGIR